MYQTRVGCYITTFRLLYPQESQMITLREFRTEHFIQILEEICHVFFSAVHKIDIMESI